MRILLFPDQIAGLDSGSHSARASVRQLLALGHDVAVIDTSGKMPQVDATGVHYFRPPTQLRWWEHFASPKLSAWFDNICDRFRPDYFVMVGTVQKPAVLARRARRRRIKTAFLFYINDFYCHRIYSGLVDGPCTACARLPELPALRNGCVPLRRAPFFVKGALVRWALGREIKRADRVMGYSKNQASIYATFGVAEPALKIIGFQFDPSELDALDVGDEGYFAITGQLSVQKGSHLIADMVARLPVATRIRISVPDPARVETVVEEFGWRDLIAAGRLEIVAGLRDRADYLAFLANARGVILPTYYPTTGEFVLQEALYLGKPVIAFDVGAHKNILRDGDNALVAGVGDIDGFAARVRAVNEDEALRKRIAGNSRASSQRFYGRDAVELWDAALA